MAETGSDTTQSPYSDLGKPSYFMPRPVGRLTTGSVSAGLVVWI